MAIKGKKWFDALSMFQPRGYQLKFLQDMEGGGKKNALLRWSRQSGKDLVCWLFLIRYALKNPGQYYYIFPMAKQARRVIWNKIDASLGGRILNWIPEKLIVSKNNNEMHIEFKTLDWTPENPLTSMIYVVGADATNADDYAGISPKGMIFSEAALNKTFDNVMAVLAPTILVNKAFLILNSTPRGRNHFYRWENECKTDKTWHVSVVQTYFPEKEGHIPYMEKEEIDLLARKNGDPQYLVDQEYGCSYEAKTEGSYYQHLVSICYTEGRVGEYRYNPRIPVDTFYDIGVRDKMCIWFRQLYENKVVFIDYYEETGLGTDDLAKILLDRGYYYGRHYLPWDGGHRKMGRRITRVVDDMRESIREMRVSGQVMKPVERGGVIDGINKVRARFWLYFFDEERCQSGIQHLMDYSSKRKNDGSFSDMPEHDDHSHCADALRTEAMATDSHKTARQLELELLKKGLKYSENPFDE